MTVGQWDVIRAVAMTCQSTQRIEFVRICSPYYGNHMMMTDMDMPQSLRSSLARRQKEQSRNRASDLLTALC